MIQYKVCLLGAPCVGKTSLAARFVHGGFSGNYHSTIGVKIDKKVVDTATGPVRLIVWDVQGEERYDKVLPTYLNGMSGYLLVVDGTRPETSAAALRLRDGVRGIAPSPPYVLLQNKADLPCAPAPETSDLIAASGAAFRTSALTGAHVDEAFGELARLLLDVSRPGTER